MIDYIIIFGFGIIILFLWCGLCIFKYKKWSNKRKNAENAYPSRSLIY